MNQSKEIYKVLIVDDEEDICDIIESNLNDIGIDSVDVAHSGTEAINLVSKNQYDLVISDVKMEEMNGIEFFHLLRSMNDSTWLIFITGGELDPTLLESGAFHYLTKPFSKMDLKYVIQRVSLMKNIFTSYEEIFGKLQRNLLEIQTDLPRKKIIEQSLQEIQKRPDLFYSLYFGKLTTVIPIDQNNQNNKEK
jgi:CheY-like chemotaxis protein